jgi:DNA-directed RNA polymerase subunit M/transcription elongation factor TFIIS
MRFCQSCNNMLVPRENRSKRALEYACKPPCTYIEEDVDSSCVFMNELVKDSA